MLSYRRPDVYNCAIPLLALAARRGQLVETQNDAHGDPS